MKNWKLDIRLEKRLAPSKLVSFLVPVISLVIALLVGAVILALSGANPLATYAAMLAGAFGTPAQWMSGDYYNLSETLVKAIPLMLCGLGIGIAFRMLFWNIGAEGQLAMGGIAAAGVALFLGGKLPSGLILPLMVIVGFLAGAIWGVIPALLKAYLKVNEIITTLMMNYIAILLVEYLFYGPWKDPQGYGFPGTAEFDPSAWLPRLPGTRVHLGLIFAVVAAVFIWLVLSRTKWGYEIQVIGENPRAAKYAGINLALNIALVMVLSGGLAGIAGMAEVSGISHRLQKGLTVGYGFTGIIVAWLARLKPGRTLIVAFLLAALLVGGDQIQITMQLPAATALILQGAILFCMLGGELFTQYRLRWRSKPDELPSKPAQEVTE
ncbi:MAG TPA: ABC transporter permease [Anaerolineaceae bacterium]|nr:ABC transporter permease [Anaerolineaceae bacterium]